MSQEVAINVCVIGWKYQTSNAWANYYWRSQLQYWGHTKHIFQWINVRSTPGNSCNFFGAEIMTKFRWAKRMFSGRTHWIILCHCRRRQRALKTGSAADPGNVCKF